MRQDQLSVIYEEIERFTETITARLMALEEARLAEFTTGHAKPRKGTNGTTKAVKVTNGTRGRPRAEMSKQEAAAYLGVHPATIDDRCKRGLIPMGHTREGEGRKHFFFRADLDAYGKRDA